MTISTQTRKRLWARSGDACAICKAPLTTDATGTDPGAVLGEECDIVSPRPGGPRHRQMQAEEADGFDNLTLLCPTHHAQVDKQVGEYTEAKLREIKRAHETAVRQRPERDKIRIRDVDSRPLILHLVESGGQLMAFAGSAEASEVAHPDPRDRDEARLLGAFVDLIHRG
jgi:hypothetical protein